MVGSIQLWHGMCELGCHGEKTALSPTPMHHGSWICLLWGSAVRLGPAGAQEQSQLIVQYHGMDM